MSSTSDVVRPIDPAAVAALRRTVRGTVAYPAAPAYAVAGDARPAAVVLAADEADVSAAVRVAATHGLGVGRAEGALLVEVTELRDVRVDPATATATVGVAATWRSVLAAAGRHGLAPVPGWGLDRRVGPDVLGGAAGPFARSLGLCSDHVRSLRVVGADGHVGTADGDLAHALLGAPAPGLVTEVELALTGPVSVSARRWEATDTSWLAAPRATIGGDGRIWVDEWTDDEGCSVAEWLDRIASAGPAAWEQGFLLAGGAAPELAEVLAAIAADAGGVTVDALGGATDRLSENAADASGAHYLVTVRGDAEPRTGSPARLLEPWLTGGSLLAHHGVADDRRPVDLCWSPATAARLAGLRRRLDPLGVFR